MATPDAEYDLLYRALDKAKEMDPANYDANRVKIVEEFARQQNERLKPAALSPPSYEQTRTAELGQRTTTAPRQLRETLNLAEKVNPNYLQSVRSDVEKRFSGNPEEYKRQMSLINKSGDIYKTAAKFSNKLVETAPQLKGAKQAKREGMFRIPGQHTGKATKEEILEDIKKGAGSAAGAVRTAFEYADAPASYARIGLTGEKDPEAALKVLREGPISKYAMKGVDALGLVVDIPTGLAGTVPAMALDMASSGEFVRPLKTGWDTMKDAAGRHVGGDLIALSVMDPLSYLSFGAVGGVKTVTQQALKAGLKSGLKKDAAKAFAEEAAKLYSKEAGSVGFVGAMENLATKHKVPMRAVEKTMGEGLASIGEKGLTLFGQELASKAAVSRVAGAPGKLISKVRGVPTEITRTESGNFQVPLARGGEHARRAIKGQIREQVGQAQIDNLELMSAAQKDLERHGLPLSKKEGQEILERLVERSKNPEASVPFDYAKLSPAQKAFLDVEVEHMNRVAGLTKQPLKPAEGRGALGKFLTSSEGRAKIKDPNELIVLHARDSSKRAAKSRFDTWIADNFGSQAPTSKEAVELLSSAGRPVYVPKQELAEMSKGIDDAFTNYSNGMFSRLLGHWKQVRLSGRPTAALRVNIQGDLFTMWMNGVRNPGNLVDAFKIWNPKYANEHFAHGMTYGQARELLVKNKIGKQSGAADLISNMGSAADLKAAQLRGAGKRFADIRAAPGRAALNAAKDVATLGARRPWSKAQEGWDLMGKSMSFADMFKRRGLSPNEAIRETYRILPDYTDLNKYTRAYRAVVPFGTYEAKMLDILPRSVARAPGLAMAPFRMVQAAEANTPMRDPSRAFQGDSGLWYPVPPPADPAHAGYGMQIGIRDTLSEQIGKAASGLSGNPAPFMSGLHPILGKPGYELAAEKDMATGEELKRAQLSRPFSKNSPVARAIEEKLGLESGTLQAEEGQAAYADRYIAPFFMGDNLQMLLNYLNFKSGNPYPVIGGGNREYGPNTKDKLPLSIVNLLLGNRPTLTTPVGPLQDVVYSDPSRDVMERSGNLKKSLQTASRKAQEAAAGQ